MRQVKDSRVLLSRNCPDRNESRYPECVGENNRLATRNLDKNGRLSDKVRKGSETGNPCSTRTELEYISGSLLPLGSFAKSRSRDIVHIPGKLRTG
jgi:hypothetical protein